MSVRAIFGFSLAFAASLLLAVPSGAAEKQTTAKTASRTVETTPDIDYFGFDLRTVQNVTLDQCSTACVGDKACKAFTYNPKVKWCFLKSDFAKANPFPGAIAGKIITGPAKETAKAEPDLGAAPKLSVISQQTYADARQVKERLAVPSAYEGLDQTALLQTGNDLIAGNDIPSAMAAFRGALSLSPEDPKLWLDVARRLTAITNNYEATALAVQSAVNGYLLTRNAKQRAESLDVLAKAYVSQSAYRPALNTYKESLKVAKSKTVQADFDSLRSTQGFRVTDHTIDQESATPRACVQFSEPLVKMGVDYTPFVTLDGAAPKALEAEDNQICVEGLEHGKRYAISVRSGLPSSVDEPLEANVDLDIYVKDRTAMVHFTGDNFVLPGTARRGIPLVSVNTDSAELKLYRVGDRGLTNIMGNSQFFSQLDSYTSSQIEDVAGQLVWTGTIDIKPNLNKEVVTSFPVDEALPQRKPGVYILTAFAPHSGQSEWDAKATQWFVVSDIGLATFAGTDGLNVFARSLASAKPLAGVELTLLAKNNEVLGTSKTDDTGRATFTAGLMRGTAGMTPAIITAKNGEDDFVFLDMTRAGFDLSDRGVTGRAAPGAIDVLPWTERGIYRVGETVHAAALARDTAGNAIEKLPLTFIFTRPDGVEDRRMINQGSSLGGYALDLPLEETAMRGTWTMQVYTDPKGSAIAEKQFRVDDFVPDRVEFDIASADKSLTIAHPSSVTIDGRFLYGAPAAGLSLEGEVNLKPTHTSEAFPGYQFGLADEDASEGNQTALENLPLLDEEGKATFDVNIPTAPSTTQLLNADIVVRMLESGGRAVERTLTVPVRSEGDMIGIKPEFDGALAENAVGKFNVININSDGQKTEAKGLIWKLIAVQREYQWYQDGSSWRYEPVNSTRQMASGTVDATTDGGQISVPTGWGRYRLEVESPAADGPVSSVEFEAGYYVEAATTETPDGLEVALDKDRYAVGETAKLKISPRFAGEVLVTVGSETLITTKIATIAKEGGEVELPITADWGAGAYVTATLYRPGDAQESRMPMRAIGLKWLTVDPADRNLAITLEAPEKMLPRQPLAVSVAVKGAEVGQEAYVTVAAVDVGILNLTRYEAPNPDGFYFGQRQLGLEIRDLYGRLIDGSLGETGRLRTGGDGSEMPLNGKPPTEKLVAFFSGVVKLDADGKANISFDIPQFNGTARLMAVAWSKTGVGHAQKDVIIRDPVVITASMPRFVSPDDMSVIRLDVINTDAPTGDYTLTVTGNDAVDIAQKAEAQTVKLETGGKLALTLPLTGKAEGDGLVTISLSDGKGMSFEQAINIPVRSGSLPITTRLPVTIQPNASLTVDKELLSDSMLAGASVALNVSRSSAFDVPAMLMTLDRYPYGCAEQTTSRALPLLYLSEMNAQSGLPDDGEVKKRVQEAIYRVLSYQSSSGSFGLWSPGSGDLWLDAYVTDFLSRARELKYEVPDELMVLALDNLQNSIGYDVDVVNQGNQIAYALYVLARNKKAAVSDLRYYADTRLSEFPTPLAKAHLAAALALYGDQQRSASVFEESYQMSLIKDVSLARSDYGSSLRDSAATLALAAESRPQPGIIPDLIKSVASQWESRAYTSTQEQSWMLLAARSLKGADTDLKLNVNGADLTGGFQARMTGPQISNNPVIVTNNSDDPVSAMITTVAAPAQPLAAGGDGFEIDRTYYTLDGEEANVTEAHQNDRYVVVLHINELNTWPSRILVTDMLPAGFEIDNPGLVSSARLSNFDWLSEVEAAHTEFRSDRFVAAFDRNGDSEREITLAYVVRAVTPGNYEHPAAVVEDMYRPQFSARTASGRMEVLKAN